MGQGLRTSTHKLATVKALVDYSVRHHPTGRTDAIDVPIADLARRVLALYWPQMRPYDGTRLRQTSESRSRIFDAIITFAAAAGDPDFEAPMEAAAKAVPEAFRFAINSISLCLARQSLPRLQRLPGAATGVKLLYDDSFFHDNVTRSDLHRRGSAVHLYPGIADGLASLALRLRQPLESMWVDDVLRLNRLSGDQRRKIEEHLFGRLSPPTQLMRAEPGGVKITTSDAAITSRPSNAHHQGRSVPVSAVPLDLRHQQSASVLRDDLGSIARRCAVDEAGCWLVSTTSAVPCRATGDDRPERELPKMAPHRWAWMVANGRSSDPLPGSLFQVWRHCEKARCCNPDHLYLTDPDGEESSAEDAEEWLQSLGPEPKGSLRPILAEDSDSRPTESGGQARVPAEASTLTAELSLTSHVPPKVPSPNVRASIMRDAHNEAIGSVDVTISASTADSELLYRRVVALLQQGVRTATYKLATMTALVEFSAENVNKPGKDVHLSVPISDLAQRVIALYWTQVRPFEGRVLKQSTQSSSRVLDGVLGLQAAAGPESGLLRLEEVAQRVPEAYRRAVDNVGVTLAQQPLPRLQRLPGAAKSTPFLFDDSFLHDNVSRAVLQAHGNAIQLKPGVAQGLAVARHSLHRTLASMWTDDVLRLNRIPTEQRPAVEKHLFGSDHVINKLSSAPPVRADDKLADAPLIPAPELSMPPPTASFADRLNYLFESHQPKGQPPYSMAEVATQLRMRGLGVNLSQLTNLRLGLQGAPPPKVMRALAAVFGVDPAYLSGRAERDEIPPKHDEAPQIVDELVNGRASLDADDESEVDVGPWNLTGATSSLDDDVGLFASRLNALFELHTTPDGRSFTNSDVASSLQEDGLPVTEGLIARLRAGSGTLPPERTLDALAFFFDVNIDYFTQSRHSDHVETLAQQGDTTPKDLPPRTEPLAERASDHQPSRDSSLTAQQMAEIVSALSGAASQHLEDIPVDMKRVQALLLLIRETGAALAASAGQEFLLPFHLMERIAPHWPTAVTVDDRLAGGDTQEYPTESNPLDRWTRQQAGHPAKPGRWTLQSFVAAVEHPADRAFLTSLLDCFSHQTRVLGSHDPFWYGVRPGGGLFVYPYRLRHPPFQLLIDGDGRLTIRGNWRNFPKVVGHPGFAELAEMLGQDERGPASSVRVEGLDAEELWDVAEVTARTINS